MPATIILTMPFLKPGGEVVRVGEVPMVKPAGVRIEFEYQIKVVVETLVRWICATYDLLICGTFKCGTKPRPGTLGNIMYVETNLDMNAITNVFDTTLSGTIRIGGKLYNSTTGEIFTDDVEIIINSDYEIVDVLVAGCQRCIHRRKHGGRKDLYQHDYGSAIIRSCYEWRRKDDDACKGSTFGGYKYSEQFNDRSIQRTEEWNHYLGRRNRTCRSDIGIQRF